MLDLVAEGRAEWNLSKQTSQCILNITIAASANPQFPQPPLVNNNNMNHDPPLCGSSGLADYNQLSYLNFNDNSIILNEYFERFKLDQLDLLNDDKTWLFSIGRNLPPKLLKDLLDKYSLSWQEGMSKEPIEHKKQNAGRYNANIHFRLALKQ